MVCRHHSGSFARSWYGNANKASTSLPPLKNGEGLTAPQMEQHPYPRGDLVKE